MAHINKEDGTPAKFTVDDMRGNVATGHFELTIVPSFAPGTRCGDLTFVIDEVVKSTKEPQIELSTFGTIQ